MIREHSAGGVVVRRFRGRPFIAAVRVKGGAVLALPKGHIDPGETPLEAAVREVREETGVEAEPVAELEPVRYWYSRGGTRVRKQVDFFLMRYRSGSVRDHDEEVDSAEWVPLDEAVRTLTHGGEREVAGLALSRLRADR